MFCGLPTKVAAEPMLAAAAKPKRKGTGSHPRRAQPSTRMGAMAKHTTSFTNKAESPAATAKTAASTAGGERGTAAKRRVRKV